MITIRRDTLAYELLTFLAYVGEFPYSSLQLLGNSEVYRKLIYKLSQEQTYGWLSSVLGVPQEKAHIGQLSELQCELVIRETKKQLAFYDTHKKQMNRRSDYHDTDARADANC